ncbi:MAG: ComF family protein [Flavobacteriales bacterium]|nr:ComF family protein [Flavobacteriales bacterium]
MKINFLLDFFFPKRCACCSKILSDNEANLCVSCISEIPFTHWSVDRENELYKKINSYVPILAAYSLMYYYENTSSKAIIYRLKYQNFSLIGKEMSVLFENPIKLFQQKHSLHGIVYVPIHEKKKKIRGYNQLEELSISLSQKLGIPIFHKALKVSHYQESQTTKNKLLRFKRRRNVFEKNESIPPGNYLLIDDVSTSGSTIVNCVRELHKNSKVSVVVITMAVAL